MKKILLILISVFLYSQAYCQCDWEWHDSLCRNKDWNTVKQFFVPADLNTYPLVLEDLTDEQQILNERLVQENYYAIHDTDTSTKWQHLNGNVAIMHDDNIIQKRFKKYFTGDYVIVNIDSIQFLPIEKYPYVLMYYEEVTDLKDGIIPLSGRVGYYIWDRRSDYRYPVYSCLGPKEDKLFFAALNK